MKKMLLATALAYLFTGCAQQTFTVQNKPAAVAPRKPSPIISSFLELGRKLSMQPKNCSGAENIVKETETQQTFVNGLLGFNAQTLLRLPGRIIIIAHNNCMSCPSIPTASICTAH